MKYLSSAFLTLIILNVLAYGEAKLEGINFIKITQVEDRLSISYYKDNPLREEGKAVSPVDRSPVCGEGKSHWALWVWNARKLENRWEAFLRTVKDWDIDRVYLQVNEALEQSLLDRIKALGLEVFLLDGSRTYSLNFPPEFLGKFEVDGVQVDIEPYLMPDFNVKKEYYLREYLRVLNELKPAIRGKRLSVVIPFWFDKLKLGEKPMLEYIFEVADEVVIMAYRDNFEEALNLSKEEIAMGGTYGKPVFIGFELHKQKDEIHRVYRVDRNGLVHIGTYKVRGSKLSISKEKLKSVRNVECKGVSGFVIHSFGAM